MWCDVVTFCTDCASARLFSQCRGSIVSARDLTCSTRQNSRTAEQRLAVDEEETLNGDGGRDGDV